MKWLVVAAVIVAALGLAANGHAQETPALLGDADCDTHVSSLDATVTLQYAAALSASVPCADNADVDGAGTINSIDANLMLQTTSGVIPGFVRMTLAIDGSDACNASACTFEPGAQFDVSVSISSLPDGGYIGFQSSVFRDHLDYFPTATAVEEISWPETFLSVRSTGFGVFETRGLTSHGAASAFRAPFPESTYNGPLVTFRLGCPAQGGTYALALLPYAETDTLGSGVRGYASGGTHLGPESRVYPSGTVKRMDLDLNLDGEIGYGDSNVPVSSALTINCV